jgi:hypothetical protein
MNHSLLGQRSLEDVVGILGHQLRSLGHEAIWDEANDKVITADVGYNVLVEGFTPGISAIIADLHSRGARFLCVATEEPTPKGFNWGTQREMAERQRDFPSVALYLDGILALVPGQHVLDWYGQHAPTAYVELGYAPSLVRRPSLAPPRFDFGFYGTMSKRRLRILKKLGNLAGKRDAVRIVADFTTQTERDVAMQEAKVILQIRKFDAMGLVSSSRCGTALCLGRPVVAEPHDLSAPWDSIVRFTKTEEEFYAVALTARAMWQGLHAGQFEKFRTQLSPELCIGAALRQLGLTDGVRRAA